MSPPDSTEDQPGIYIPKPRPDIYTVLLGIALFAVLVACILLFLEFRSYDYSTRPAFLYGGMNVGPGVALAAGWF